MVRALIKEQLAVVILPWGHFECVIASPSGGQRKLMSPEEILFLLDICYALI